MRCLAPLFVSFACIVGCNGPLQRTAATPSEPTVVTPPQALSQAPSARPQPPPEIAGPETAAPNARIETSEPIEASEPYADLWARIRDGFQLDHQAHARIERELARYRKRPAALTQLGKQAAPYLHWIAEAVEARGMPLEIALLPMIESGFQPFAYSHGRAAGLWQFIPSTGRHFGLRQDWWYDGRRDVTASTEAALDYLQRLHQAFDGDWYRAIAAYNAGEARVRRAVARNVKAGKPTDFWRLSLPNETQQYVPRLLAVARLVAVPDHYGVELETLPDAAVVRPVDAQGQIDLAVVARLAAVDMQRLYTLNPAYNRWATPPEGPHRFLLPLAAADRLEAALEDLDAAARMRWERHQVRAGESLSVIAQRYGTSVRQIREANDLRSNVIRTGQHVLVPRPSRQGQAYVLSAEQRLHKRQTGGKGARIRYTVQPGDSLWSIARQHRVSQRSLARWNGMALRDPLPVGRKLVIYGDQAAAVADGRSPLPVELRRQRITYRVREGDSLYKIAQRFRVSIRQIRAWNRLERNAYLHPGQPLLLHVDVTRQS